MDALSDAVNVARIGRVPERSGMALVGLGCEEQFERDIGGRGRIREEGVRLIVGTDVGSELAQLLGLLLEQVILLCHIGSQ